MKPDTLVGRLIRTLILWVGGVWLLCVFGVVWYAEREITYNFDNELVEVSHRMFDIALDTFDRQGGLEAPTRPLVVSTPTSFKDAAVRYQIVDAGGRMLMRSAEAPAVAYDVPLAPGFANVDAWRIYTVRHPVRNLFLQVADPIDERRIAVNRTLYGLILPLSAVLPLLALVLRNVARRELDVLQQLASAIGERSGTDLRPISLAGVRRPPQELQSVADHVNRLLERLAHSLDVERALAVNAAHELRTPLASARLRLQTALDHDLQREDVVAALTALQVLSHRTEKLLQLSRAESGAPLARAPVDLVQLAATVAQEFWQQPRALARLDLLVPQDDEADALPAASGDFDALAIALRNLVENALNYGGSSRVQIEVTDDGVLVVRDFGPGVSQDQLHTLQLRHVRHSAERTGYGLGMSIISTIVEKHGAKLRLTSPPAGAPSGFEARITLSPATAASPATSWPSVSGN